jgi:hypothetical protein
MLADANGEGRQRRSPWARTHGRAVLASALLTYDAEHEVDAVKTSVSGVPLTCPRESRTDALVEEVNDCHKQYFSTDGSNAD